jgi:hypothetical protein
MALGYPLTTQPFFPLVGKSCLRHFITGVCVLLSLMAMMDVLPSEASANQFNWTLQISGKAKDIAEGGGKVWVIGTSPAPNGDYWVYRLTGAVNAPSPWTQMRGGGVRIAVDGNGLAWVVNAHRDIYHATGDQPTDPFRYVVGKAKDIGARGDSVWIIGGDPASPYGNAVLVLTGDPYSGANPWTTVGGAGTNIAVDDNGLPLITNANDDIFTGGWAPDPSGPSCPSAAITTQFGHTCATGCANVSFPCYSNPGLCSFSVAQQIGTNCSCNTSTLGGTCYWSGKVTLP